MFLSGKVDPCYPETGRTSLPRSRAPQGRAGLADAPLSPRPHFRFCRPRVRYASGRIRRPEGLRLSPSLFSLVFRRVAGIAARRGFPFARIENRALRIGRSLRSYAESARNTGSCPAGRAAGLHPSRRLVDRRRRHPIPLGRIRQSYISLCGEHTRPGVAISPSRGLRLTDRVSDRFRPRGLCRRKKARARKRKHRKREIRYVRAYDSGRRRLACRVWNKRPFPVQRPSRATSASSLSRYCPYWFLSMGPATSRSFSSDIHPLR